MEGYTYAKVVPVRTNSSYCHWVQLYNRNFLAKIKTAGDNHEQIRLFEIIMDHLREEKSIYKYQHFFYDKRYYNICDCDFW